MTEDAGLGEALVMVVGVIFVALMAYVWGFDSGRGDCPDCPPCLSAKPALGKNPVDRPGAHCQECRQANR